MKKLGAALAMVVAVAGLWSVPAQAAPPSAPKGQVTDPRLLGEIHTAEAERRAQGAGAPEPTVVAEVATADTVRTAAALQGLGVTVTGSLPGAVVQVSVPVSLVDDVAALAGVTDVRSPRRAGYVPTEQFRTYDAAKASVERSPLRTEGFAIGTGITQGYEVTDSNASLWQLASYTGAGVKVGIVDFFNLTYWDVSENGPVPDSAHQFCRDTPSFGYCFGPTLVGNVDPHGTAVAEVVKDMAPGAELYIATVATVSDLRAAIDWFAANGVHIITRSLGAAFDGPGDGTGPLADAVDYAGGKGITWFNSAGNDAAGTYLRRTVPTSLAKGAGVGFARNGTDNWLMVVSAPGQCYFLDGVRWFNDWNLPAASRTDYSVEFYEPSSGHPTITDSHFNPNGGVVPINLNAFGNQGATGIGQNIIDANQGAGAPTLEGADLEVCPTNSKGSLTTSPPDAVSWIHVTMKNSVGFTPDTLEVGLAGSALLEQDYEDVAGSAAKPVVDSRNPALVAVGATEQSGLYTADGTGNSIAFYSSQGPTNDGRIKPDMSAQSGMFSATYRACTMARPDICGGQEFHGTSSASPTAAGAAAILLGAGLAVPGPSLAALTRHFVQDKGPHGADSAYGTGSLLFPTQPLTSTPLDTTPAKYSPLLVPSRILDTRAGATHVGSAALTGPYQPYEMVDLDVAAALGVLPGDVSAVAVNLTSVGSSTIGHLQAFPYLRATPNTTSTLNISTTGEARPNFAIVPVGQDGKITIFSVTGGEFIVDLLGSFSPAGTGSVDGRFVPLAQPERWMDTRTAPLPASFGGVARKITGGESIDVPRKAGTAIPAFGAGTKVAALVVNITSAAAVTPGYLRAYAAGLNPFGMRHSNVNYVAGVASANTAIVPIVPGSDAVSILSSGTTDVIVDVVGYITSSATDPEIFKGLYVPTTPTRMLNRQPFTAGQTQTVTVLNNTPNLPAGQLAVFANLTVASASAPGHVTVYPGPTKPATSNLNYVAGKNVANGALVAVANGSGIDTVLATMAAPGNLFIDISGYFIATAPPPA